MAKGRPTKWATAQLMEPVGLGKAGIHVIVWDKWGRKRRGTLRVTVGGLQWFPCNAKKPLRLSWNQISEMATG